MKVIVIISIVYLPILVISFVLPAMITLFKKNIHSFFCTLPSTTATGAATATTGGGGDCKVELHDQTISSGLVSVTRDPDRIPNVVESSKLMKPNSPLPSPSADNEKVGFIDEIGGDVDGLMSCTESLGFESSDERRVSDKNNHEKIENGDCNCRKTVMMNCDWRSSSRNRTKVRSFPPPLSSLNRNGEPSFFLRPVRKDGRLELTEVRIHRPQILQASRHDGRLTLHFVPDHDSSLEEEEEEEEEENEVSEQQEDEVIEHQQDEEEEEIEDEVQEQVIAEEKEESKEELVTVEEEGGVIGYGEWRFESDEQGLRRCHEMVMVNQHQNQNHHHHHLRMCGISIV